MESQEDGNKPHPEPRERSVPRVLHARLFLGMAHAGVWSLRGSLSRPSVHSQPVLPVPSALKLGAGRGGDATRGFECVKSWCLTKHLLTKANDLQVQRERSGSKYVWGLETLEKIA